MSHVRLPSDLAMLELRRAGDLECFCARPRPEPLGGAWGTGPDAMQCGRCYRKIAPERLASWH
jgi:hypothetical protein